MQQQVVLRRGNQNKFKRPKKTPSLYDEFLHENFPDDFLFAVGSSAYQTEGAWAVDGKGESIWDRFSHMHTGRVARGHTGNVTCDSYHHLTEDVHMLKELGVQAYRLSISWCRLFPTGRVNNLPNPAGLRFYNRLINSIKNAGVEPIVTLYYYDLPQALQDEGGWENEETIRHFKEYASFCFDTFGDRVKFWLTINEPYLTCWTGYETGMMAPGVTGHGQIMYKVGHNLLRAHAEAYRAYDELYRSTQQGQVSIALDADWLEPFDTYDVTHVHASERALRFRLGWFADPIFGDGDYPAEMRDTLGEHSKHQRLPTLTEEDKQKIKGSADFFALNQYSTSLVVPDFHSKEPSHVTDVRAKFTHDKKWPKCGLPYLRVVPWGLRRLLCHIRDEYGNPPVLITENGYADDTGDSQDADRVSFLRDHLQEVLKATNIDGCDVKGYTAWTLMDCFEWLQGYTIKFGLYHVDFTSEERTRTPKLSAQFYSKIINDRGFKKKEE